MNQTTDIHKGCHEYTDANLPLHHKHVEHATGVCAKTLKAAIMHNAAQFGPGVVKIIQTRNKTLLRFNPYRYTIYLAETSVMQSGDVQSCGCSTEHLMDELDDTSDIDQEFPIVTHALMQSPANTEDNSSGPRSQPRKKRQSASGARILKELRNARAKPR